MQDFVDEFPGTLVKGRKCTGDRVSPSWARFLRQRQSTIRYETAFDGCGITILDVDGSSWPTHAGIRSWIETRSASRLTSLMMSEISHQGRRLAVAELPRLFGSLMDATGAADGGFELSFVLSAGGPDSTRLSYTFSPGRLMQEAGVRFSAVCPVSGCEPGAHEQNIQLSVALRASRPVPISTLLQVLGSQAGCEIYGLLKSDDAETAIRPDRNPRLLEEIAADIWGRMHDLPGVAGCCVRCESPETIHNLRGTSSVCDLDSRGTGWK